MLHALPPTPSTRSTRSLGSHRGECDDEPRRATFSIAAQVGGQARGVEVRQFPTAPDADLDITATPDLSVIRISNTGADTSIPVRLLGVTPTTATTVNLDLGTVAVPSRHDLVISVSNWATVAPTDVAAVAVAQSDG